MCVLGAPSKICDAQQHHDARVDCVVLKSAQSVVKSSRNCGRPTAIHTLMYRICVLLHFTRLLSMYKSSMWFASVQMTMCWATACRLSAIVWYVCERDTTGCASAFSLRAKLRVILGLRCSCRRGISPFVARAATEQTIQFSKI